MTNLNTDFKVIGLSEIKASVDAPISDNIELPGYKFHHTPSNSAGGGVGIYVKSDLKANERDDLSFANDDFETSFRSLVFSANDLIRSRVLKHKLHLGRFIPTMKFK